MVRSAALAIVLCTSSWLSAGEIAGTVTNKTKGKPAAGDEVVLLSLSDGMQESGRTKTDANGKYSLSVADDGVQHLIRVIHQGVNYHQPAPQGTTVADVDVYDVAEKVDKILAEGRVLRVQASDGQLRVSEMYILRNESSPPRTRMSDHSFEVVLPPGAEVEGGMAAGPGGMPVTSFPVATGKKNHYAFMFPIRPGQTQFQVSYHLGYTGKYSFDLTTDIPLAEFGVMLPKSMHFQSSGDAFQQATDESGMSTYVAKSVSPGQRLPFAVSGEGSAPPDGAVAETSSQAAGGGLGSPEKGDHPFGGAATWYVLGGFTIVLIGGAYFVQHRRTNFEHKTNAAPVNTVSERRTVAHSTTENSRSEPSSPILEILKEELFQIETERLQGALSQQQYDQLRNGINALIRRHIGNKNSPHAS